MKLKPFLFTICFLMSLNTFSQDSRMYAWADSVCNKMTLQEQIAQLLIIRVPSADKGKTYEEAVELIEKYKVGGICFFAGNSTNQLKITKIFQKKATIPLLVSIDGEWGLGMRLNDVYSFPRQMMLGAIENDSLVYEMGAEIARQCKKMGIHINYAPVVDLNSNPRNPVIGMRAFGENKYKVTNKAIAYMKGMQDNGVLAVAKHFPGHGDTETDSHKDIPVIKHTKAYIDSVDLFTFNALIKEGIKGIMVGHLRVPAYDAEQPASLSFNIVTNLLKKGLHFNELVFTDGMEMGAIIKNYKNGEADLKALLAGNDVILVPYKPLESIEAIRLAAENDTILQKMIERKCKRILQTKYRLGLRSINVNRLQKPSYENILNAKSISQSISDEAITVVKNENQLLPIDTITKYTIACVSIENTSMQEFRDIIDMYGPVEHIVLPNTVTNKDIDSLLNNKLMQYNFVVLAYSASAAGGARQNYGVPNAAFYLAEKIQDSIPNNVVILFGTPYLLSYFEKIPCIKSIIVAYQSIDVAYRSAAQLVFGGLSAKGTLPVTAGELFKEGQGLTTEKTRLGYKLPQQIGLSPTYFNKIDSIANKGIATGAYPGCQVLVAKDGYIIHNKSYGKYTYANPLAVSNASVYDLASVTKVAATTLAIMKMYEEEMIKLDDKLSIYLPYLQNTNKEDITIREVLSHFAGFKAFYPFWKETMKDNILDENIYRYDSESKDLYYPLTDSLFILKTQKQKILNKIATIDKNEKQEYLYSDFGFILLGDLVEKRTCKSLDVFMQENFYSSLGMNKTAFNPIQNNFDVEQIAPTENDTYFRKTQIRGYVHDQASAMLGGVAGHAGLFSNASDLVALFQMLLNEGSYGGVQYLKKETIETFNKRYYETYKNRRALGFDKPLISSRSEHVSSRASQNSFGHSGFTGTYFWVDPESNLIYIFLSNRIYPDAENRKLALMNIRTNIHEVIYDAIKEQKK